MVILSVPSEPQSKIACISDKYTVDNIYLKILKYQNCYAGNLFQKVFSF